MLSDGYHDLPAGKIASIVTYLEMRSRPSWIDQEQGGQWPGQLTEPIADGSAGASDLEWYRAVFRAVGEDYLWFSRLLLHEDALRSRLSAPGVQVFLYQFEDKTAGLLETHAPEPQEVEISLFGLTPEFTGQGYGRSFMAHTLRRLWQPSVRRVWLHTCTLDHPKALRFYRRAGFVPYKRGLEIADDPRNSGALPRHAAAQIPLL